MCCQERGDSDSLLDDGLAASVGTCENEDALVFRECEIVLYDVFLTVDCKPYVVETFYFKSLFLTDVREAEFISLILKPSSESCHGNIEDKAFVHLGYRTGIEIGIFIECLEYVCIVFFQCDLELRSDRCKERVRDPGLSGRVLVGIHKTECRKPLDNTVFGYDLVRDEFNRGDVVDIEI